MIAEPNDDCFKFVFARSDERCLQRTCHAALPVLVAYDDDHWVVWERLGENCVEIGSPGNHEYGGELCLCNCLERPAHDGAPGQRLQQLVVGTRESAATTCGQQNGPTGASSGLVGVAWHLASLAVAGISGRNTSARFITISLQPRVGWEYPIPDPVVRPLRHPEVPMPKHHPAATAFSAHDPKKRTLVRRLLATLVIAAAMVASPTIAPSSPVGAVPVSERTATWIAVTSREVALELRAVGDLPESETRGVAGRQIDEIASLVAYLLDADAERLRTVWSDASVQRKIAMFSALSQVGVPYRLNADAPFIALDCSSLTKYAWSQAGVDIDRGSAQQYARANRVSRDSVQVGDLVWYPGHIMMSLGVPELIVHARSGERAVEVHRIDSTRLSWMRWVSPID